MRLSYISLLLTALACPVKAEEPEWMEIALTRPMNELYNNAKKGRPDGALLYALALTLGRDTTPLLDNITVKSIPNYTSSVRIMSLKALNNISVMSSVTIGPEDRWLSDQLKSHEPFSEGVIVGYGDRKTVKLSLSDRDFAILIPVASDEYWWTAVSLAGKNFNGNYQPAKIRIESRSFGGQPASPDSYYDPQDIDRVRACAFQVSQGLARDEQQHKLAVYLSTYWLPNVPEDKIFGQLALEGSGDLQNSCRSSEAFQHYKRLLSQQGRHPHVVNIFVDITPEDIQNAMKPIPSDAPPHRR